MKRTHWMVLSLLTLLIVSWVQAEDPPAREPGAPAVPDQATLDKQFEQTMSGATLVGFFTTAGKDVSKSLKEEKYTISKVTKLAGDTWLFNCRIQYGDHDASLPLPLRVIWSGDTPVITLTDMPIPGFGTFTCRVMVFRDQYAGTWSGGDHGGHLFGRIERAKGEKK